MLTLDTLKPARGSKKKRKRVGRGPGSGLGKTSGRGHKGQNSRSGGGVKPWFEGGGFPLALRLPKRGFKNIRRQEAQVVNVGDLGRVSGDEITPETLVSAGLVKRAARPIKLLANGELDRAFTVRDISVSRSAAEKITAAGGSVATSPKDNGSSSKQQEAQAE